MIQLNVTNETAPLEAVVVGIAESFGGTPEMADAYDPKSKEFIAAGEFPKERNLVYEMEYFVEVLERYGVEVYRPKLILNYNQIFSRDIAFVIGQKLVLPNIIEERARELQAIQHIVNQVNTGQILHMPAEARAEGGDVMPWNEFLFVGYSEPEDFAQYITARTNREGLDFLQDSFGAERDVRGFQLNKSDTDPRENALHLDCCFQPVGRDKAIMYRGGFKNPEDADFLESLFGADNIIEIDKHEMYMMCSNVFSISPDVVVSERGFTRVNNELRNKGLRVEEVPYFEISKMEGLLRCTTMPLRRTPNA